MPDIAPDFNHNQPVYTVSEISASIKRVVEDHFGIVRLRGEISGWRGAHSSGHGYFKIKDESAVIDAVCWRGTLAKLACKPEEGLEVICTGRITTYGGKSSYQIVVEHIEPAGIGALMALLEKRRKQFEAEGLFKAERKKPLPYLPQTIGVITSPTGAVIRDILHRITGRFPVRVLLWPVAVQGEGAAEQVAEAIRGFNKLPPSAPTGLIPRPDVLIVARGGGSIEDLWAFNEEIVVRAAAESAIPLISAVGHETDTTLIDFVADQRAPTPTAAAEMAVPVRAELLQGLHELEARLTTVAARLFDTTTQRLDDWSERLSAALPLLLTRKTQQLAIAAAALTPRMLQAEIKTLTDRMADWQKRLQLSCSRLLDAHAEKLAHLAALLESVNYQRVLERGFVLARDDNDRVVSSAEQAKELSSLSLTFRDGKVRVKPVS